jgi:hypothetical protein
VRKSRGVDFKVQDNSKLDCVVEASILTKQGLKGHPGQETARYGADFVRKIGRSSLLPKLTFEWLFGIGDCTPTASPVQVGPLPPDVAQAVQIGV